MSKRVFLLLFSLFVFLVACSQRPKKPARLQFVSMVPLADAKITIASADDTLSTQTLAYATPSGYKTLHPGHYTITYSADSKTVLRDVFVLGKDSYQTLLIAGMIPDSARINPHTTWFSIKKLFAGSESDDPNGFLPQYIMLRDRWRGSKNKGTFRFINASPLANQISVWDQGKPLAQQVLYPRGTEPISAPPGDHSLEFMLGDVVLKKEEVSVKKGFTRTVIIGNATAPDSFLKTASYQTVTEAVQ